MSATLLLLGLFLLCAAPGLLAADAFAPAHPLLERRILGLVVGLALLTIASYVSAMAGLLLAAPLALVAITVVLLRRRLRGPLAAPLAPTIHEPLLPSVLVISAAWLWFALPVLARPMPLGWDPAFHTAIIESLRRLLAIPATWAPWEPLEKFNYPSGLHAALALAGRASGVPSDRLFTLCFALTGALMLLLVWALGHRFGGTALAGALAVAVYGFTDGFGTLTSHASWGGLPNLAGLALMSAFLLLLTQPSRGTMILAALCGAAAAFVHHLSFILLAGTALFLGAMELVSERRLSESGKRALQATLAAVLTAGLLVLLKPEGRYDVGQGFRFEAEKMIDLAELFRTFGAVPLVLGVLGLCGALATLKSSTLRILPVWAVALLAFWIGFDVVYRSAIWLWKHENYTAFTPSRGLTDAAVPLAVCAGIMLARCLEPLGQKWLQVLVVAALLVALDYRGELSRLDDGSRGAAFEEARRFCTTVKEKTPPDAVIFAPGAGDVGIWLPYLCDREFNYFPEPTYGMSPYRSEKGRQGDPDAFARFIASSSNRKVFYAAHFDARREHELAACDAWHLYELTR